MNKRINYIDNLRWMAVSLLIIYHAAEAYNTWDEANYIFFSPVGPVSFLITFISPWFMPLMFLLAGVSSYYSLQKRGYKAFIKERLLRLGIPLVFGIVFLNPVLSYIADKTHNGYSDGFFAHYGVYYSKLTDITGYDGGFTLGHLWFVFILIVVSVLSLAFIKLFERLMKRKNTYIACGIFLSSAAVATFDLKFYGKPLAMFFFVYLLGYYYFSNEEFTKKISKYKWPLAALFLIFSFADAALFTYIKGLETLNTECYYASFIFGLTSLIALGHDHLDFSNKFSKFNSKISYVFYIVHFPIVILCQYYLSLIFSNLILNFILTLIITYPLTYMICIIIEKTKYIRVLFGLKNEK